MNNTQPISSTGWIKYGLAGFALGIVIVAISGVSWFTVQVATPPPTATLVPTPTVAARALLDEAHEALYSNGEPQLVIDALSPHLEEFTNPSDLSEALQYLSMAEMGLGHYQLSAAYLERLVQIEPTAENYATLGRIYDAAGDLKHALANYILYLQTDDPSITVDIRQIVQQRIDEIQAILTSFTPTPGS